MATAKAHQNARETNDRQHHVESPKDTNQDLVEYVTDYAKRNPGYAALWCLGIGFILGWKLKPW